MTATNSRARPALIGIVVLLAALRWEFLHWVFYGIVLAVSLAATREVHRMALQKGLRGSLMLQLAASTAFFLAALAPAGQFAWWVLAILILLLLAAFCVGIFASVHNHAIQTIPMNVFSPVYVGLPLAIGLQILGADRMLFLAILLSVWSLDSAAYFAGRKWGRNKLAPGVSPNKTWEGAIGGFAGAVAVFALLKLVLPDAAFDLGLWPLLAIGMVIGIAGQLGDLAESLLKRDAGVKDSGTTGTGHGGVLDRIDSLLFAFPAVFLFLLLTNAI